MGEIYVGLDVSKEKIVGMWKDRDGKNVSLETFPVNEKGMEKLAERTADSTRIAVEASTTGVYVYDYLASRERPVVMSPPSRIRLIAESDKKTDRNDAEILVDLLRNDMLPTCYVPDKGTRELRDLVRHRRTLVEISSKLKTKIRMILTREGLTCPQTDVLGDEAIRQLNNSPLQPIQKIAMNKFVVLGLYILDEEKDFNLKIYERFLSDKHAQLLETMPGVGPLSAVTLMSEIGDIGRFPSHSELASYAGLVPRVYQSGNTRHDGSIKPGSKIMRHILVQDAWQAIRRSRKLRKFYQKLKRKKGSKVAIVAVARKMLKIMWFMLTREEEYLAEKPFRARSARS